MVPISTLKKPFQRHRNVPVVLWGAGTYGVRTLKVFQEQKLDVVAVCDKDEKKWGTQLLGVDIISPKQLEEKDRDATLIQVSCVDVIGEEAAEEARQLGFSVVFTMPMLQEDLFLWEAICCFEGTRSVDYYKELNLEEGRENQRIVHEEISTFLEGEEKLPIFVSMHEKTGDYTMINTLAENHIPNYFTRHYCSQFGDFSRTKQTVKIVMGVRDPIATMVSAVFQHIFNQSYFVSRNLCELNEEHKKEFLDNWDGQILYDSIYKDGVYFEGEDSYIGENFMEELSEHVVDVYKHPFDTEKGYTVIKEKNVEIFIYQLEKLNHLLEEFSQFVGTPISAFATSNETTNKWIGPSYEIGKKELKLSQRKLDCAYETKYSTHFYKEEDIRKFKAKWQKNVDPKK